MKRILSFILILATLVSCTSVMSACGGASGGEIALVTDNGTIDDKSFNQGTWEGLTKFAKENKKSYKYYQPASDAKDDLLASISLAIEGGAAVVVCPGFNFETAIYEAQVTYPDTKFILLDGQPNDGDYTNGPTYRTDSNVMCILYAEQ